MADDPLDRVFRTQSAVCTAFGSPFYGGLCAAIADGLADDPHGEARALFARWDALSFEALMDAAVSLRFLGAVHDLALSGDEPWLTVSFPPAADAAAAWAATKAAIPRHAARLAAFMAHEPQTNEVRRSACLLPGFLVAAEATGLPLRCMEVGASAGLNQLWDRFRYRFTGGAAGDMSWGEADAPLELQADWTGPSPPLDAPIQVAERRACDRNPIDLADPAQRRRLKAYLWPDQTERLVRFDTAAAMAVAAGVTVEAADAAEWIAAEAAPREGATTVVYHSIFWQYLPSETQSAIVAALERHGAGATATAPLAWLRMEPVPGQMVPIELRLTLWPGGHERRLATVQAHGAQVAWEG